MDLSVCKSWCLLFVASLVELVLGSCQGIFVLFVMILPTVTFMTTDSLRAVPRHYREASLAIGPLAGKPSGV